jgi:MoaA/NifB/PqqE/SkfB family radical SAM enzyme
MTGKSIRLVKRFLIRAGLFDHYVRLSDEYRVGKAERLGMLRSGQAPMPRSATIELTMRCNLDCGMCFQRGRHGGAGGEMSLAEVKAVCDNLERNGVRVVRLMGGEIFMRRDIFDILDHLESGRMRFFLVTNGTLLGERELARLMRYRNLDRIILSFDGIGATHDRIRASPSAYGSLMRVLSETAGRRFKVSTVSVMQNGNMGEIGRMVEAGLRNSVDHMFFLQEMYCTGADIEDSRALLGGDAELMQSVYDGPPKHGLEDFRRAIGDAMSSGRRMGVFTYVAPKLVLEYPGEYWSRTLRSCGLALTCDDFRKLYVDVGGNAIVCPHIRKGMGSLVKSDLSGVWNCDAFKEARRRILANNMLPICDRCCMLNYAR